MNMRIYFHKTFCTHTRTQNSTVASPSGRKRSSMRNSRLYTTLQTTQTSRFYPCFLRICPPLHSPPPTTTPTQWNAAVFFVRSTNLDLNSTSIMYFGGKEHTKRLPGVSSQPPHLRLCKASSIFGAFYWKIHVVMMGPFLWVRYITSLSRLQLQVLNDTNVTSLLVFMLCTIACLMWNRILTAPKSFHKYL